MTNTAQTTVQTVTVFVRASLEFRRSPRPATPAA
ncbi:hypothetical protein EDF46_2927 [Frondihabitans sp. PhB188]|nr:hypothetical protein EDF46_2927 [Frondihabitans sp. PhB188]